jgi:toxin ParE1/3/4
MSNYSLTDQAIEDINEICDYLSNFNLDSATEFLNSIENKCQFLVQFSNMGRSDLADSYSHKRHKVNLTGIF